MSDILTKDDLRDIIKEEVPRIVADAIKINNDVLVNMFKTEILAIYEEFGKVHAKFEEIDKRFDAVDERFDAMDKKIDSVHSELIEFKRDTNRQMSRIHSTVNMAVGYKSVIQNIDERLYFMEQKAAYEKNNE